MAKHAILAPILAGPLLWGTSAAACVPPPSVQITPMPGETTEAFYDRIVAGSWPNSWETLSVAPPGRNPGESDADYATRLATWQTAHQRAYEAAYERSQVRRRAALLAEESARWESGQVVLAESLSSRTRGDFEVTRFRIIDRSGQADRGRVFTLRYPLPQTSCDYGPPEFAAGKRWVMFARPGPLTNDNLIGYYDLQSAQDPRTRRWLEGIRPDGTPVPAARR